MSEERFLREDNLIGRKNRLTLAEKSVAVFGLGGVGSYCVEALARAGVGHITICDGDKIDITNINRQLYALTSTIGRSKTEVAKERILDINPSIALETFPIFFSSETAHNFDFSKYDYVVDCIDTVTSKLLLCECAKSSNKPVIVCLGTGNKLNPTAFEVADISKTEVCPLAKVMRRELKKRGLTNIKAVFSKEEPKTPLSEDKRTPASISFVPPVAGLLIASEVIKDLLKNPAYVPEIQ